MKIWIVVTLLLPIVAFSESKDWRFNQTIEISKEGILLVCSAQNKDLAFARAKAMEQCLTMAADYLVDVYDFLVVEQKLNNKYDVLKRLSRNVQLEGLKCVPKQDYFDGSTYWVKCWLRRPNVKIREERFRKKNLDPEKVVTQLAIRPSCSKVFVLIGEVTISPCHGSFVNIERPKHSVEIVIIPPNGTSKKYLIPKQEKFYDIQKIDLWN